MSKETLRLATLSLVLVCGCVFAKGGGHGSSGGHASSSSHGSSVSHAGATSRPATIKPSTPVPIAPSLKTPWYSFGHTTPSKCDPKQKDCKL